MAQRTACPEAVELIKKYEGTGKADPKTGDLLPYLDPVGIWTIGWGHAIRHDGRFLRGQADGLLVRSLYPTGLTVQQATALLDSDLVETGTEVLAAVVVELNDNQFGALVSFTFNLGIGNLKQSTLLKRLNAGDYAAAADEFSKWVKAGGKTLPGLVERRKAEAELFSTPI